jgi:hypothetical protein
METTKVIKVAYAEVREFNDIAGNLTNVTVESIDNQLGFIFEELTETIDGLEAGDKVELLDGACDLFVTVAGLLQKLEAAGYNVAHALGRVNANNLSKFPKVGELFPYNPEFSLTLNEKYQRVVLKDGNGKVRKPDNFVAVDLSDLVPKE